jgi:hypothetical protein
MTKVGSSAMPSWDQKLAKPGRAACPDTRMPRRSKAEWHRDFQTEGTLQADKFTGDWYRKIESPEGLLSGLSTWQYKRFGLRFLSGAKHLYQRVLNTLAAPTLVVSHFPSHAFQAEKSFQLAWACLK